MSEHPELDELQDPKSPEAMAAAVAEAIKKYLARQLMPLLSRLAAVEQRLAELEDALGGRP